PVVILTANAVIGAKENYLKEGFDAFLSKPVEPDRLEKVIFEMLPDDLLCKSETSKIETAKSPIEFPIIDGVDFAYGRIHFTSDEDLKESINLFYRVLKSESQKLEEFFEDVATDEGLNSYRIQVHSMKNSAALVGIVTLSGMAKVLEDSARKGDRETIAAMTPIFLKEWNSYKEKLQILCAENEENLKAYDKEAVTDMLDSLKQAADEFDISRMDELMEALNQFSYEDTLCEKMEQLSVLVSQFDVEQTVLMAEEIKLLL
ncbi:MAG: hypothetical protein IKJ15_01665, partial [Lachnospiraceae bacterium]|nr:hypothetical protein [Lachnospiraceae bacterium]